MKNTAVLSALAPLTEQPFWLGPELLRERTALLQAVGLSDSSRFRPPPLPAAFGPGTAFPAGIGLQALRRGRN